MYGDEFISLSSRSNAMDRDMRFLEMALPGLCMTCARMKSSTQQDLAIVDPSCEQCIHSPEPTKINMCQQWWPHAENQQQKLKEQYLQMQVQSHPRYVHRMSWDSAFSSESASVSSKGTEDSFNTTHTSISPMSKSPIKLFSNETPAHLEWPDWSKWVGKTERGSFDSIDSAPFLTDSIDSLDEAPCLSRSPSPASVDDVNENCSGSNIIDMQQALMHPAKTGFALWVGNLSPKTTLFDLRILFGTPDLQSIYLIQRTGCAFVNYISLDALNLAMKLFESRGASLHDNNLVIKAQISSLDEQDEDKETAPTAAVNSPDRYFICKSLTVDDLEIAKKTGKWSTQLRNKDKFNAAFMNSRNTYLVFSANRTSAFYGIAKLEEMFTDPHTANNGTCKSGCCRNNNNNTQLEECRQPEVFKTEECRHPQDNILIPTGETVFDPLRGSQFWKVENCPCVEPETDKWTSPAKITWISASNSIIPFSRTRQLKNSLNMNKPIKVARDGTEIDPEVGGKLFGMFSL